MKRYLVERELIQNNIQVLQKKAGSAVIWATAMDSVCCRWRRPAARQVSITLR